jgi:uncharacterized protein (TIGR02001 family)
MQKLRVAGGLALLVAGAALPAAAQATIGADAAVLSQYVWRGLTFTNKLPVIEPDVWLSVSGFTAGAWANIDPTKCTGSNDICESGGTRSGIAEIDYWIEYGRAFGNLNAKAGYVAYTFNKDNGFIDNTFNTGELYANFSIGGMPVTPALGVWYDIDNVKGLYLQPQLSYGVKAGTQTVTLTALAGISAGQEANASKPLEGFNFAKSGLTHIDFGASTSFSAGAVSIAPSFHVQISHDDFTKFNGADPANQNKGAKFWGGVTLSWSHALGATKSE